MRREQRGSASLLVLAVAGLLVLLTLGCVAVTGVVRAHRTAQGAADLAALGAASALGQGGDPCGRAGQVSRANGGRLASCVVEGLQVWVRVEVDGPSWWGRRPVLSAEARAGPAG